MRSINPVEYKGIS